MMITRETIYGEELQSNLKDTGLLIESITEAPDNWLMLLSERASSWALTSSDRGKDIELKVGQMVLNRILDYCQPRDEEVEDIYRARKIERAFNAVKRIYIETGRPSPYVSIRDDEAPF